MHRPYVVDLNCIAFLISQRTTGKNGVPQSLWVVSQRRYILFCNRPTLKQICRLWITYSVGLTPRVTNALFKRRAYSVPNVTYHTVGRPHPRRIAFRDKQSHSKPLGRGHKIN